MPGIRPLAALSCAASLAVAAPLGAHDGPHYPVDPERHVRPEPVERGAHDRSGRGFFMVGFQGLDLDALNARLAASGLPEQEDGALTLGGGGWGSRGRLLVGGQGHARIGRRQTTADGALQTRLSGGHGTFDVGYRLLAGSALDVTPMVGIGGGALVLEIAERGTPAFDDVLADPRRGTRLVAPVLVASVSLGIDVAAGGRRTRRGTGGLAVGARAGWLFSTRPDTWRVDDAGDASGGPRTSLSGPFVMAMVGGWGAR